MAFETMFYPPSIFYEDMYDMTCTWSNNFKIDAGMHTHFGLTGVHTYTLSVVHQSYMISGISFGYDLYRENQVTGSYGFNITPRWRVSTSVGFMNYWVKNHSNRFNYMLHTSTCYDLGDLKIGGWLHNMNMPRFQDDAVPMIYTIRAQYAILNNISCIVAARGTHERLPFFNTGISWALQTHIVIGVGANTDPAYLEYMLFLPLGHLGVRYSGTLHEYLGLSHAMHITFDL